MSSLTPDLFSAAVITVSDSSSRGEREDVSGPAVAAALESKSFHVVAREVVHDEKNAIEDILIRLSGRARLVVTTGGTGIAVRDVTPEATQSVCDRLLPGISERIRIVGAEKTKFAALSRALCGTRGEALILNLPGSPKGAVESLEAVIDLLPHALELLAGNTKHG
jgi:molybdenum cofactor synthesis domain-containing protein